MVTVVAMSLSACSVELDRFADASGPDAGPSGDASANGTKTVIFGEGDPADTDGVTMDTFLSAADSSKNFGAETFLITQTDWGNVHLTLLYFDVSSIARGSDVIAAELMIWSSADPEVASTDRQRIYPTTEAWHEDVATYHLRLTDRKWTSNSTGSDYHSGVVIGRFTPPAPGERRVVRLDTDHVRQWVDDPTTNHGIVIRGGKDVASYVSSESDRVARRPALVVTYEP